MKFAIHILMLIAKGLAGCFLLPFGVALLPLIWTALFLFEEHERWSKVEKVKVRKAA